MSVEEQSHGGDSRQRKHGYQFARDQMIPNITDQYVASVRSTLIEHPAFTGGMSAIRRCHAQGGYGLEEPGCLLITGLSGSGKSTLRKEYANLFPRRDVEDRTEIPVLHLELPAQPTIKNVAERILLELGDPLFYKGSAEAMTARVVTLIRNCRVELVILDEFNHFIDHSSEKVEARVADWLKHLVNVTKVPFVLMGLHRCRRILQSNEQLRRRFSRQLSLEPFSLRSTTTTRTFQGLLQSMWSSLPFVEADRLMGSENMVESFHYATYGLMGYVMTLVSTTVELVVSEGKKNIDRDLLARAFREGIWPEATGEVNPFHSRFISRPLTRAGEPFFNHERT